MTSVRKADYERARSYLNTNVKGKAAQTLTEQLAAVLDRKLPARLNELSDSPEGSSPFPSRPNVDLVGTIATPDGDVDILVERVTRGGAAPVWLFANETLKLVPELYDEMGTGPGVGILPSKLYEVRFLGIPFSQLLAVFIGMPGIYLLASLLNRLLSPLVGSARRTIRRNPALPDPEVIPSPVRLLLLALIIRWAISEFELPLLARQFWSSTASVLTIAAVTWLAIMLTGHAEAYARGRLRGEDHTAAISALRFARRSVDILLVFVAILVSVYRFGLDPTAAIAGLGVGGIAVALAAQKTLENVIGGISLVMDKSVHIGDSLRIADAQGTVEDIGLRSTRIRTLDRTVLSVPNGQLANLSVENLSRRDKFWFHPRLQLRLETSASETRSILDSVHRLLGEHSAVESNSLRVNLNNFAASSLDVEISAYVFARDSPHFLQIQEDLLLQIMDVLERLGAPIALPAQTMHLVAPRAEEERADQVASKARTLH